MIKSDFIRVKSTNYMIVTISFISVNKFLDGNNL